jgi:hypothetical protein
MSQLEKALDHISSEIKKYRETKPDDGNTLVECGQQISATLFYLEKERAKYHNMFQKKVNQFILEGDSVNRAENKAHVLFPEMYLLRRIIDSAYKTCDAIRTQVSWIKSGLIN